MGHGFHSYATKNQMGNHSLCSNAIFSTSTATPKAVKWEQHWTIDSFGTSKSCKFHVQHGLRFPRPRSKAPKHCTLPGPWQSCMGIQELLDLTMDNICMIIMGLTNHSGIKFDLTVYN
jgi:hypothetical protein